MQSTTQNTSNTKPSYKPTRFEFRLLWLASFILVLPTVTIKRLLPTQWRRWRRDKNIFTVVRESREIVNTIIPMAFRAY